MRIRRSVTAGVAALAIGGVLGLATPAVQAKPASMLTWTHKAPVSHPAARVDPAMAYDKATGTVVLFSGYVGFGTAELDDTWTWG